MNNEEIELKHLEFACGDAMIWFRNVPKITRSFVFQRLVDSVTAQFRSHEIQLRQFEVQERTPKVFLVKVNNHAVATLDLGREVCDE